MLNRERLHLYNYQKNYKIQLYMAMSSPLCVQTHTKLNPTQTITHSITRIL